MSESQIPLSFRHAMDIARSVGIPYLWIDALCIVQDDHIEWQEDAAMMSDIYFGSALTIAAADATDSSKGCFFKYGPSSESQDHSNDKDGHFFTTSVSEDHINVVVRMQPRDVRKAIQETVLSTRGWVQQEQLLSHRTVYCMRSGFHWQCRCQYQTETGFCGPRFTPNSEVIPPWHQYKQPFQELWWGILEDYSGRKFSVSKDRLPAMAGTVRNFQSVTGYTPILGLWEHSLPQDLLWMCIGNDVPKNPLTNVPSWLSCSNEIHFEYWKNPSKVVFDIWRTGFEDDQSSQGETIDDHAVLIDWDVKWTGQPLTSDVKSSILIIDAPVQELFLSTALDCNPPYFSVEEEVPDFSVHPKPWRCASQFDALTPKPPGRYPCLLLRSMQFQHVQRFRETFLILELVPEHLPRGAYRRIGIAKIDGHSRTFDHTLRRRVNLV